MISSYAKNALPSVTQSFLLMEFSCATPDVACPKQMVVHPSDVDDDIRQTLWTRRFRSTPVTSVGSVGTASERLEEPN
jgi:hypothetical protein